MIWRDFVAAAIAQGALPSDTMAASVVSAHPTPPVGTPGTPDMKGNSARPERFVVAISEQVKQ